jgi:hypothetical protein
MKSIIFFTFILSVINGVTANEIEISGVLKPEFSITDQTFPDSSLRYVFQVPLRLMLHHEIGELDFNSAWVPVPTAGNPALSGNTSGNDSHIFRMAELERRIFPSGWNGDESFSILQNLDRLNLSLRTSIATLTAGRQAIFWGVAKSISPTDFIAPFQYGTVNTEYRTGVDAIRSVFPVGMMSELDAGYVFGKNGRFSESGCWLRGRFYLFRTDATLITACFRKNLMIGGSLNRSLGRGTGWMELAVVTTSFFGEEETEDEDTFWSISTGYDRSWFNATLYGYLEYHFNSSGSDDAADYTDIITGPAWTNGGIYLLGRHYLCPGLSWTLSPLLNLNASALFNLADPSAYISLSGEYSVREDIVLNMDYRQGVGKKPLSCDATPLSEFGSWPGVCFMSSGYYF